MAVQLLREQSHNPDLDVWYMDMPFVVDGVAYVPPQSEHARGFGRRGGGAFFGLKLAHVGGPPHRWQPGCPTYRELTPDPFYSRRP